MDLKRKNPALQQEPIGEPALIIAPREQESLFMWIRSTGRFMPDLSDRFLGDKATDELDDILNEDEETEADTEE